MSIITDASTNWTDAFSSHGNEGRGRRGCGLSLLLLFIRLLNKHSDTVRSGSQCVSIISFGCLFIFSYFISQSLCCKSGVEYDHFYKSLESGKKYK